MTAKTIGDMTPSELRRLIRDVILEVFEELGSQAAEDEDKLEFRPEIAARLSTYLRDRPRGIPAAEVIEELGLDL